MHECRSAQQLAAVVAGCCLCDRRAPRQPVSWILVQQPTAIARGAAWA